MIVSYEIDGKVNDLIVDYNKQAELPSNPQKDGYNFDKWILEDGIDFDKNTPITKNIKLKALFIPINYTIYYDLNEGIPPPLINPTDYNVETETFTLNNPTKDGYEFAGWTGSNGEVPQTVVKIPKGSIGDRTYTANWSKITYSITYDLQGGTIQTANPTQYDVETEKFTLNNPTKDGYEFVGWTGSNGGVPQTVVTIPKGSTGNKNYTAHWTDEYTIVLHSNNGQNQIHRQKVKFDEQVQLHENTFTNGNKVFKEWTTNPDGSGVKYVDKAKKDGSAIKIVNLPVDENLEVHLYTQWQEPGKTRTTFDKGQPVNAQMKKLAGNSSATYNSTDENIHSIKRATQEQYNSAPANKVDVTSTYAQNYLDKKIWMWFVEDNENGPGTGTIYYYSEADIIYLNETNNYLFHGLTALKSIDLTGIDSSIVKNMESMFGQYKSLEELDLSSFNTSSANSMQYMFNQCESLTSLNLSSFNTCQVNTMKNMFSSCKLPVALNITNFNTFNVKYTEKMFDECESLESLNISNFNTSKVTTMKMMFFQCSKLTSLNLSNFNTSNVTNMMDMFNICRSLTEINISSFDTSKVTDMSRMFASCNSLVKLDVSSFNTSSVTNMEKMFSDMYNIETIYASDNFVTAEDTNGTKKFEYNTGHLLPAGYLQPTTPKLEGGQGTKYNANYLGKDYARIDDPDNGKPGYFTRKSI